MGRSLVLSVLLSWPAVVAMADVPSYEPPGPVDTPAVQTPYEQGYEQGYALGQALGPLCCGCMFMGAAGATGGLVYFLSRRKKQPTPGG